MRLLSLLIIAVFVFGCTSGMKNTMTKDGKFISVVPTKVIGSNSSLRWTFEFKTKFPDNKISQVDFMCLNLSGTLVSVDAKDLKVSEQGFLIALGPILKISKRTTPWLYSESSTKSHCYAKVFTSSSADGYLSAPLIISSLDKKNIISELSEI